MLDKIRRIFGGGGKTTFFLDQTRSNERVLYGSGDEASPDDYLQIDNPDAVRKKGLTWSDVEDDCKNRIKQVTIGMKNVAPRISGPYNNFYNPVNTFRIAMIQFVLRHANRYQNSDQLISSAVIEAAKKVYKSQWELLSKYHGSFLVERART